MTLRCAPVTGTVAHVSPLTSRPTEADAPTVAVTLGTYSHAIPAMQEEAVLIAGLVFADK